LKIKLIYGKQNLFFLLEKNMGSKNNCSKNNFCKKEVFPRPSLLAAPVSSSRSRVFLPLPSQLPELPLAKYLMKCRRRRDLNRIGLHQLGYRPKSIY